jgi:signal transduction histidine kinase/streptogramin lyase
VWLGTFGGVLRFDPQAKPFTQLIHREGDPSTLASNAVSAIYQEASGTIWVATYGAGLDRIDGRTGRIVHHTPRPGDSASLCNGYLWDLAGSTRVTLWAGGNGVFCSFSAGRFTSYPLPLAAENTLALHETADGTLWLGTNGGLYRKAPGLEQLELVGNAASGLVQPINSLHEDRDHRLWMGGAAFGDLAWYDPASGSFRAFRRVAPDGIWDIESDPTGRLWLATGNGLATFDPSAGVAAFIKPAASVPPAVYYSLQPDRRGRWWLGTSRGLMRYDPATGELREFAGGDGPGHVEFNRHAAHRGPLGELFFGGMNGVTRFIPDAITDNPHRPPVVLTSVRTFGDEGERSLGSLGIATLTLSPRDRAVSFEFAALNYTEARRNRYAYRLDGFDAGWIEAGRERTARYTNLPAGEFVFRVRGSNNDGLWSDQEIALPIRVLPPFWQTAWFETAVAALLAGLIILAHRLRTAHLAGLERLRLRIASDLHDDLGSELSGIALASGLVAGQPGLAERDRARLAIVGASAVKVMDGLRDIIWCISPDDDTLASLEQRMRSVARTLLVNQACEFEARGMRAGAVDMAVRRHLFLIYKELLHNIVRHSGADRVRIVLEAAGERLRLEIADNGRGTARATAEGSGLRNIRRRAQEIGASIDTRSEPGAGTTTTIVVGMTRTRRGGFRRTPVG